MSAPAKMFETDPQLQRILSRIAPQAARRWHDHLARFGAWVAADVEPQAVYTDAAAPPFLVSFDRAGTPVNDVRTNPLWDAVSRGVYERGIVGLNYGPDPAPFAITFAMGYLLAQADLAVHCPATMTGAVAYVLSRFAPDGLRDRYLGRLTAMDGTALTGGTWATELHGGSDVGATTTTATPAGSHVLLDGLKWFTSNPVGGLAVATARPVGAGPGPRGLGLYLVPYTLEDGSENPMRIRRLKDKLGTRGVPTAEIELAGTRGFEIAAPLDGLRLMRQALGFSRLHNAMAAIGAQRRALEEVVAYTAGRHAFGNPIIAYPMVQDDVLRIAADLAAGMALSFEAVAAFDASERDIMKRPWMRLATALAKAVTADDAVASCRRAMEAIGGNAYTNDYPVARLVRDASVLTIWEGPANIQALEVVRLLASEPGAVAAFHERIARALADVPRGLATSADAVAAGVAAVREAARYLAGEPAEAQRHARRLMTLMAETLASALLVEDAAADPARAPVLRAYVEARLAPPARRGIAPGTDWAHREFDGILASFGLAGAPAAPARRRTA